MNNSEHRIDTHAIVFDTGQAVEQFICEYNWSVLQGQEALKKECEGSIADIGLRVLPFLLRISSQEGGIAFDSILPIASGVEMLKQSALVIDDVFDESDLRNSKPTTFSKYGAKTGFAIGTVISSLGFQMIAIGFERNPKLKNSIAVFELFSRTHANIYIGQFLDIGFEGNIGISEGQYLNMISKTTACFIQASLVAGAMLWGAGPEIIKILGNAGLSLGVAYQIRDDIIDVLGDQECMGSRWVAIFASGRCDFLLFRQCGCCRERKSKNL